MKAIVKYVTVASFCMLAGCSDKQKNEESFSPVELVNPLMGTDSEFRLSTGNTYPAIARPSRLHDSPDKNRGTSEDAFPFSMSKDRL
jgi:hypothetical protein